MRMSPDRNRRLPPSAPRLPSSKHVLSGNADGDIFHSLMNVTRKRIELSDGLRGRELVVGKVRGKVLSIQMDGQVMLSTSSGNKIVRLNEEHVDQLLRAETTL